MRLTLVLFGFAVAAGCSSTTVALVGKQCDDAHPCPSDMTCVPTANESTRVCVMTDCVDASDCVPGYTCTDGACRRDRPVSDRVAGLGDGAALGRGTSQRYDARVKVGNPAPTSGESSSYRVTGGVTARP